MTNRRQLITGLISFIAAPAIVRAASLMPVKVFEGRVNLFVDANIQVPWPRQDGSLERPWATLQQAVEYCKQLDLHGREVTINFSQGTY